mmetsp:Transcript_4455/g.6317  ORF Transcript_4455/g.6317 Transcript_4455/m.6317 type:complete len:86 (-) Transcript_4455:2662-2919(-)
MAVLASHKQSYIKLVDMSLEKERAFTFSKFAEICERWTRLNQVTIDVVVMREVLARSSTNGHMRILLGKKFVEAVVVCERRWGRK